uniref:CAP-Gly domain-containing protein n=1 Tax=Periophthalmus magnuspinnatus TaxID=409849 RepID=A0A3B3ZSC9_9GOBI
MQRYPSIKGISDRQVRPFLCIHIFFTTDGQQCDQKEKATKIRGHNSQSPEKSNSRGPLRNSTQENTTRNTVEFREPLASYREATTPPHPSSPPDLSSLQSAPGSSYSSQPSNSNPALSQLVYQRDTKDKQTDRDLDSTHSSTMERMEVRYLNDLPALDTMRTNLPHSRALTREALQSNSSLKAQLLQSTDSKESGSTPSTSPGSASQRLENLRRHQPDDKLEKLKERIRKQRQHLEETAEKEKLGSYLEQPLIGNGNCGTCTIPTVKVRKVATAPSAPIYKGFNTTETKIQTPDGKIWHEEDFHNLSREIYKDLSQRTKSQLQKGQRDLSKESKSHKPVRKVQKVVPASEFAKPVINPASWREGQKLVKMVLGKDPMVTTEESQKTRRKNLKGPHCRSSSDPCAELNRPQNTAKKPERSEFHNNARTSSTAVQEPSSVRVGSDMLSVDIKGILDDLQLECKTTERGERVRGTSRRGASHRQGRGSSAVNRVETGQKKRYYDADKVRQYIAQQQEKRKRQQVEEKNALREEAEKKQQRLQELYRKQREGAKTVAASTAVPAQMRLQETFNKLLLEGAQLKQEPTQMRPLYQPSGESDKENMRLEQAQSPSSSDRSLNHPPLSREASSAHLEHLIPTTQPVTGPVCSNEHLLSQLLRLESAIAASEKQTKRHTAAPSHSPEKMSRIEALKATAMSLSNRIESEACKLAGEGFNYGLTTAVDVDTILAPRSSHTCGEDRGWTAVESEDMAFSTERMSGTRSMYNRTAFPEQDFVLFKAPTERNRRVNSQTLPKSGSVIGSFQDIKWLANDLEKNPKTNRQQYDAPCIEDKHLDRHDSSGSISEGPLSEGSLTDGDHSSPPPANAFRPIGHQGAVQHSVRKSHQRLSEFQKDAEKCAALTSLLAHQENSKPAWEEFNKGSPLSVINIFTKSLQGNVKERNSPAHLQPSGSHVADLDDFVSTQSSGTGGPKDINALRSVTTSYPPDSPLYVCFSVCFSGELQYSPAVLQQRLAAELHYLESIEESVRQLGDIERLMCVSVAQHESASLTQMLKSKQQQHEQELYELKIKTEREALETKLQMEENRQRAAQEGLAATHKETLEGLQEATTKMMSQQAEAARYTADTARHIKEVSNHCLFSVWKTAHGPIFSKHPSDNSDSESFRSLGLRYGSSCYTISLQITETNTYLDFISEPDPNYLHSLSSEHKERRHEPPKEKSYRAEGSISIEDEVPTAANESLCSNSILSAVEEKGDTTSVATEYSHKFEDSITEDEIEERSFRSLLPSEAHRRESLDKKLQQHDESEEDGACHNEVSSAFSGGQDSFSHFTMEMVRQYMRDEEVRLQHQSALLRLRQKALKEKTCTELAWLEHQKKKLRDKGEDDKMPPIKKKQRGLLLKLQQEQAEIKRLQEANKAARKERQLLLKQQEEIERMRSSTLKLKERLRSAETSLSEVASSTLENTDPNVRSPSPPVSISGSETSSIMQKLKKMRSQMDEKFLTKREQQLMQRRRHAEELLQWKQRLDQEEAEVRKMEKKALAAWDEQKSQNKEHDESEKDFHMSQRQKESSIHTDVETQQEKTSIQSSPAYTDDFTSVSPSPNRQVRFHVSLFKYIAVIFIHISLDLLYKFHIFLNLFAEHISDQSDIESRIRALKEELKKRKFTAYQLKKEQKKRTKERLKAKEANLLKQLETYNDFIEKTKAELNKQPESAPDTTSQMTDSVSCNTDHPNDKMSLPDQSRSTSMNSTISDEEPPTVASTPRPDSPDLNLTPKNIQAQAQESLRHSVTSEHESEMQEELKLEISKLSKDQDSKYLLKMDKENKMDTASELINRQSPSFRQDLEPSKSPPVPIDRFVAADVPTRISSSAHSLEETSKNDSKPSHLLANSYDTFESSVDTLLRENNSTVQPAAENSINNSDQTSLKKDVLAWTACTDSHEEEIQEEIPEDFSRLSAASNHSHQFIDVLNAQVKEELKPDSRNRVDSTHSASVTPLVTDEMPGFCIGDRVVVSGVQPGTLRFKGSTSFANGFWAGVELDKSEGSNNGTYDGVLYFECAEKHGIFAPPDKVTHLTDKFEMYMDTTEDDDSFHDDMSEEENQKRQRKEPKSQTKPCFGNNQMFLRELGSGDPKGADDLQQLDNALYNSEPHEHPVPNGTSVWDFGEVSPTPLIKDNEKVHLSTHAKQKVTNLEKSDLELNNQLVISSDLKSDEGLKDKLGSLADKMLDNFVKDTLQQFADLKKLKAKKIHDASQINGNAFEEALASSVDQKDGLPFFLTQEKEEMSSPELCTRPESPVLGLSGQEELAKRLAELELSRELDEFGDDQDWFDEDYGLSSRREQQRLKQKQREEEEQLPHPMPPKLPEEPAMVVPHSAAEIEKMTHAAALEIWTTCGLDKEGTTALTQQQKPNPSQEYLGKEPNSEDQEAVCLRSYKMAVFDLTWEILQDVFAEDPNVDQPQWVKPQRVKSSSFHKVRTAGDISRIQKFVTTEVLKLYGLAKDQYQRTDWPKMLKFGRKKRDRVDNILVQELHEEESQWVNYDEDELFVKMQLADSIFDALLKDTANVLTQIYDKRSRRKSVS